METAPCPCSCCWERACFLCQSSAQISPGRIRHSTADCLHASCPQPTPSPAPMTLPPVPIPLLPFDEQQSVTQISSLSVHHLSSTKRKGADLDDQTAARRSRQWNPQLAKSSWRWKCPSVPPTAGMRTLPPQHLARRHGLPAVKQIRRQESRAWRDQSTGHELMKNLGRSQGRARDHAILHVSQEDIAVRDVVECRPVALRICAGRRRS